MATLDLFKAELMRSRALMKRGKTMFFSGLLLPFIPALFVHVKIVAEDGLPIIACMLAGFFSAIVGYFTMVHARERLHYRITCPSCKERLGYLVADPNYTNYYFSLPDSLSDNLKACPYCKNSFK
jgi:hypothetical protein